MYGEDLNTAGRSHKAVYSWQNEQAKRPQGARVEKSVVPT